MPRKLKAPSSVGGSQPKLPSLEEVTLEDRRLASGRRVFLHSVLRWGGVAALTAVSVTALRPWRFGSGADRCRRSTSPCAACVEWRSCGLPKARSFRQGKEQV